MNDQSGLQTQQLSEIAQRLTRLDAEKQRAFLAQLAAKGIDLSILPIARQNLQRAPLSFAQTRLWFLWRMAPGSSAYNMPVAIRLRGRLDVGALQRAINELVVRHAALRTVFRQEGGDAKIKTEVFMLPCASSIEKEGSIANSSRLMQWRYKAIPPVGESKPDGDIMSELYFKVRDLYVREGGPLKEALTKLTWPYGKKVGNEFHYEPRTVAQEINGFFLEDKKLENPTKKGEFKEFKKGDLVPTFAWLQADGSTSSGCWVYCGSVGEKGNLAMRRGTKDTSGISLYSDWAWCWPVNRRIIYNGASVDPTGKPWDSTHAVIKWDGEKWTGDVPDGAGNPGSGRPPFIMKPDGVASLFGPGLADGPFPEHYEPLECPVEKNMMSPQKNNPAIKRFDSDNADSSLDVYSGVSSCDPRFPFIGTTYRVSEHWQTGVLTRWCPWLAEMQPGMFVELGLELAKERGIANGDKCIVKSARGEVEATAIVTPRFKPFNIDGNAIHEVGIPWHYGWITTADRKYQQNDKKPEVNTFGDAANLLTSTIGDANTMIPETKAFMVNVAKKGVK